MDLRFPTDGFNNPISRAMGVPVLQDSRVLVSGSQFVDVIDLTQSPERVFHGIAIENPSSTQRILIAIGDNFTSQKCISVAPSSYVFFDQQTFGDIFEPVQGVQKSKKIRARLSANVGTAATGALTFTINPSDQQTVVINGTTYEFSADASVVPGRILVTIGASLAATLTNLASVINQTDQALIASSTATVLNLTTVMGGAEANAIGLSAGTTTATPTAFSGATGGVTPIIHIW